MQDNQLSTDALSVQADVGNGGVFVSCKKNKSYNNLAFLNFLRFILAFSIILWHCPFGLADDYEAHPVLWAIRVMTPYGGNQAFYLISGMLFYLVYYPKLTDNTIKPTYFLKKRAIRVYPAVLVTILVSYILSLVIHFNYNPDENINLIDLIKETVFFGSRLFGGEFGIYNGPVWFLTSLFVSYLISVFIIVVTKKRQSVYWFLIPLFIFCLSGLGSNFIVPLFYVSCVAQQCFTFFLGFFFMLFLTKFDKWKNIIKIPLRIFGLAVAVLFLFAYYKFKGNSPLGEGEMIGDIFCWIPLITCLYGLKFNIIFDNVVFKTFGAVSFHMFIWHVVVYKMWEVHFSLQHKPVYEGTLASLFIYLTLVMVVSVISYCIFDLFINKYKPVSRLKKRLQNME